MMCKRGSVDTVLDLDAERAALLDLEMACLGIGSAAEVLKKVDTMAALCQQLEITADKIDRYADEVDIYIQEAEIDADQ